MKTPTTKQFILSGFALATGALLSSCVDPYYSQNQGPPQRVTTYSAGYEVRTLPPGYRTEIIGGTPYYYYGGTYYRPRSGRYVVVEAPHHYDRYGRHDRYDRREPQREVIIQQLPRGYRTVTRNGVRYYQVNDVYYQQRGSGYVIVNF